ncbi:MAG: sulfatase-like hydrolase/transferase [Myxococcales bacterium]|nr:sulfatase-like hydrolase/transferase [Myxococcales bacterium]
MRDTSRRLGLVLALSVVPVLVLEAFNRPSLTAVRSWVSGNPIEALLNVAIVVIASLLALALTGRVRWALLSGVAIGLGVGSVHATKTAYLGKPLFPWDVLFYRETLALLPQLVTWPRLIAGLTAAALVASVIARARRTTQAALPLRTRLGVGAAAILGAVSLTTSLASLERIGVKNLFWAQPENYQRNGLALSLVFNVRSALVVKPAGYGPKAVKTLAASLPAVEADAGVQPTLLMLMSESFMDPTVLPQVNFLDDPVPNLHRLQRTARAGTLFSPVYGGGTANTEFEVLTGHSMRFLPLGSIPYQQYIRTPQPSLVRTVARLGYATEAVHPFHRWFWEREQVYEHLGFARFTSVEDMPGAFDQGPYPPDRLLTEHLLQALARANGRPAFIFGVSVEAHGPYDVQRVATPRIRFEAPLDPIARNQLSTWVEAVHNADHELGVLVDALERQSTPVVFVFFGDHQPSLPRVLRQLGVLASERIDAMTRAERWWAHQVPVVMWTNTSGSTEPIPTMSASLLAPWVLDAAGISSTPYDAFLRAVSARMPVALDRFVIDADGGVYADAPPELAQMEEDWWLLEYDQLMGEQVLNSDPEGT